MNVHDRRMARFRDAGIYLVTSQDFSGGRSTPEIIRAALGGGIRLIQLREKTMAAADFMALAHQARALTAAHGALLIINDRLDVALAVEADGVHLGQDDLPVRAARERAPDLIIGASTHSVAEALAAQAEGASYFNIGPVYPTRTKRWDEACLGPEGVRMIAAGARIPFTVMGGITAGHFAELTACGARVAAVVTAITMADDPAGAARDLLAAWRRCAGAAAR